MAMVLKVTNVRSRAVVVPLRRPVIADIGRFEQWPLILVDIEATGGTVGSSYIAPYRAAAVPSVIAEIRDIAQILRNAPVAPTDFFDSAEKRLNVLGVSGVSLIAISAIDLEGAARTNRRALRCRRRVRHSPPFLRHPLCKPEVLSGNFCHGTGLRGDVS